MVTLAIILFCTFMVPLIIVFIYMTIKAHKENKLYEVLEVLKSSYVVDNTKSDYYRRNGFHPYDTMSDESIFECIIKIARNRNTNEVSLKYEGDYVDKKLEQKALERKQYFVELQENN